MKVIAVSQRVDFFADRDERRDAIDQRLIEFLLMIGVFPIPVPNSLDQHEISKADQSSLVFQWLDRMGVQGVVLSGGNDIGSCGERDRTEINLLKYASDKHLPLLGICRGMQMIATWAGVGLKKVDGHIRTNHLLIGDMQGTVNSFHAFSIATCPQGFEILALSDDGEIEAIKHRLLPWEGWMWHPEREKLISSRDMQRARQLFDV